MHHPKQAAHHEAMCRVCGGQLELQWKLVVLDRYDAEYHECAACGCLQIPTPHWLDEAYKSEGTSPATNPDSGRFCRNFSAYIYLRALNHVGFFGRNPDILDYGGGSGIFTAMFCLAGFHCRQYDPFCRFPFLEPERAYGDETEIPPTAFDLVAALEVFEHLVDPATGGISQTARNGRHFYRPVQPSEAWPGMALPVSSLRTARDVLHAAIPHCTRQNRWTHDGLPVPFERRLPHPVHEPGKKACGPTAQAGFKAPCQQETPQPMDRRSLRYPEARRHETDTTTAHFARHS